MKFKRLLLISFLVKIHDNHVKLSNMGMSTIIFQLSNFKTFNLSCDKESGLGKIEL